MKSISLSVAVIVGLLSAGIGSTALADDKWIGDQGTNWQEHIRSTKSRAQVQEELRQAQAQGLIGVGDEPFYPYQPKFVSSRSRAEVRAEAIQANANRIGALDELYRGGN
ncbi:MULTISPECIES: DUF4148 domain-containing protein [Noviherbaspirillum]|jgi:hypothetical protein|uniref:DUF4148 domain-containing protein n=1 Tax=Noviherbaspirillum album TaxID=3080276 RepID=A0ABU6JHB7_9BURK|nr:MULTISPECIES: DUF4148 domain-containing protein [Noviherbaspirillum]MEC4722871.1 DUF4148 domain-containing protein [Noviherbaspirillum sp. CPCC 100848]